MRSTLAGMSSSQRTILSQQLCERLHQEIQSTRLQLSADLAAPLCIASFCALPSEPNLAQLHHSLPSATFLYPRVISSHTMVFHQVDDLDSLQVGHYGILEPNKDLAEFPLDQINLILCPAYAYDSSGRRLGKGGGFYDTLLAQILKRTALWGVAFEQQIVSEVPCEAHDQTMQRVITPERAYQH